MERIGRVQLTMIGTTFVMNATLVSIPAQVVYEARQDAWISYLVSLFLCLIPIFLLAKANGRFPNHDLFQASIVRFPFIGRILSLILIASYFFILSRDLRILFDFINIALLQKTPQIAIGILTVFTVVIIARMGIENIARLNAIVLPVMLLAILLVALCVLRDTDLKNFTPILEFGFGPPLKGAWYLVPYLGEVIAMPFLYSGKTFKFKEGFYGLSIGLFFLLVLLFFTIAVLGEGLAMRLVYPTHELVRQIRVTDFLDRFDVVLLTIWLPCMIVKMSLSLYLVVHGLKRVMPKFSAKQITPYAGVATLICSIVLFRNPIEILHFNHTWTYFALVFQFGIPLFFFLFLRKKKNTQKGGSN